MKRKLLIFVIVCLCGFVAVSGNITLINSKSVLKQQAVNKLKKISYRILVDTTENRLYLISNDKVIKSYPISPGKEDTSFPIGNFKIIQKNKWNGGPKGYYLGLNVPWGKYGIQGTVEFKIDNPKSRDCIKMFNDDAAELYKVVVKGTKVEIYGGPYGAFGNGYRTIHSGAKGSDVYEIQKRLKEQGYFKGALNGIYDSRLKSAVRKFEKNKGLKVSETLGTKFYEKLGIKLME